MFWDIVLFCRSLLLDFENTAFLQFQRLIYKINALKLLQSLRLPASVTYISLEEPEELVPDVLVGERPLQEELGQGAVQVVLVLEGLNQLQQVQLHLIVPGETWVTGVKVSLYLQHMGHRGSRSVCTYNLRK